MTTTFPREENMKANTVDQATPRLLCTIPETALRLHVGRSTIYELIRTQQLHAVKIGRCTRIPAVSIEAFVDRLRAQSPHEHTVGTD